MFNPYAQAGWYNPANPNSVANTNAPRPSIFGALPYSGAATQPTVVAFKFTSFNPNIMNCTVVGPQSKTYFRVTTDSPNPGFTIVHNSRGEPMTVVEWLHHPTVEIRNILSKWTTSQWLGLSRDRRLAHSIFTTNAVVDYSFIHLQS